MPKSGDPDTTNVTVVECDRVPLVPEIVSMYVPAAVVVAVETIRAQVFGSTADAGTKLAVAPAGSPLTFTLTVSVNPFRGLTFAV
jgi:hypothetical protein